MPDIRDHGGSYGGRSPNLKPENIKKGVNISGVVGTLNGYSSISAGSATVLGQVTGTIRKEPASSATFESLWSMPINVGGSVRLTTTIASAGADNAIKYQYFVGEVPVGPETNISIYSTLPMTLTLDANVTPGAVVSLRGKKAYTGPTSSQTISLARVSINEPPISGTLTI